MISLPSYACHSWTDQPDITSGSQTIKPRACCSLWVCNCSTCGGRQNGSAEPDILQGTLPAARMASGYQRWFCFLLYRLVQPTWEPLHPKQGKAWTVCCGHAVMECMGDLLNLGSLCYFFSENRWLREGALYSSQSLNFSYVQAPSPMGQNLTYTMRERQSPTFQRGH